MSKGSGRERYNQLLEELEAQGHLKAWSEYTRDVAAPPQVIAALTTGRVELLKLGRPRALTEEETKAVYDLIATLVETNMGLQRHAEAVAQLAQSMKWNARGIVAMIDQMDDFAHFRKTVKPGEEEDE